MKKVIVFLFVLTVFSCGKYKDRKLSSSDEQAYEGMLDNYSLAKQYNDSMINSTDSTFIVHCDSMFNYCVQEFDQYHNEYDHDGEHCDHNHNNMGMMQNCCNHRKHHDESNGHHQNQHIDMDDLIQNHDTNYPY